MIVYRLTRKKYKDDLSGKGAELAGGRWNSTGIAILYTAENKSLSMSEVAVHVPIGILPEDYYMISIEVPEKNEIVEIKVEDLPKGWNRFPHMGFTKLIGNNFIESNKKLILKVPSAVVQGEYNYLINPRHKKFKNVKVVKSEPFKFDKRLFK